LTNGRHALAALGISVKMFSHSPLDTILHFLHIGINEAQIIKKVICPPSSDKIEETIFLSPNLNVYALFVPLSSFIGKQPLQYSDGLYELSPMVEWRAYGYHTQFSILFFNNNSNV